MILPLFIGIGVHRALGLPQLDGVLTSLDDLSGWAADNGYEVIKFDDRNASITVDQIKDKLTPINPENNTRDPRLLLDRTRIIVYFCGHGLHAPQDQYWILSSGPNQADDRISLNSFRDFLASYGVRQIAIISDACRSPIVPRGLARAVVDWYDGLEIRPEKDTFYSSQDGAASFAFPSKDGLPAYCIFSKELFRALSSPVESALDPRYLEAGRKVVSSESLANYLEQSVPDAALDAGKLQKPDCQPGFRATTNDRYADFDTGIDLLMGQVRGREQSSGLAQKAEKLRQQQSVAKARAQLQRVARSRSEWRNYYVNILSPFMRNLPHHRWGGLLMSGKTEAPILHNLNGWHPVMSFEVPLKNLTGRRHNLVFPKKGFVQSNRSCVEVLRVAELYAAIPLYRRLWCAVILERGANIGEQGGVELITWGGFGDHLHNELSAAEALKGLSAGVLTAEDVKFLAAEMRGMKHFDPMYGIVAAYLYNGIGDISNIRRTAYYYAEFKQDVPFDIALLAGVGLEPRQGGGFIVEIPEVSAAPEAERAGNPSYVWQKTPAVRVGVAGVTPLLRAGWQFLQASKHDVHRQCWELGEHLTESPVATLFGADAGNRLIEILKEQ